LPKPAEPIFQQPPREIAGIITMAALLHALAVPPV